MWQNEGYADTATIEDFGAQHEFDARKNIHAIILKKVFVKAANGTDFRALSQTASSKETAIEKTAKFLADASTKKFLRTDGKYEPVEFTNSAQELIPLLQASL